MQIISWLIRIELVKMGVDIDKALEKIYKRTRHIRKIIANLIIYLLLKSFLKKESNRLIMMQA